METKKTLQIEKIITFFIIILLLNYISSNIFDVKVIDYFNNNFGFFFQNDKILLKSILSLFYGLYIFIYILFITWILKKFFLINRQFIFIHINTILLFLLGSTISWIKNINIFTPNLFILILPIISIGIFFVMLGSLKDKTLFIEENNITNSKNILLINSLKNDLKKRIQDIGNFFSKLKKREFNTINNFEHKKGYINNDNTFIGKEDFGNKFDNQKNNYIEKEEKVINDDFLDKKITPENIKGILEEDEKDYSENLFNIIENNKIEDDYYIEIKEIEENNIEDNDFQNGIEKNDNNSYIDNGQEECQKQEKNYEDNVFESDDCYFVGFSINDESDFNLLKDLIKKL